jgi:hypothetical protein
MPPRRNPTPSYLRHGKAGRARAVWTDALGARHFRLLPGPFDSPESRAAFAALLLELEAAPHRAEAPGPAGVTVVEVLLAFLRHAERHYRRADGSQTHEVFEYKLVVRLVRELYGHSPAREFGPLTASAY